MPGIPGVEPWPAATRSGLLVRPARSVVRTQARSVIRRGNLIPFLRERGNSGRRGAWLQTRFASPAKTMTANRVFGGSTLRAGAAGPPRRPERRRLSRRGHRYQRRSRVPPPVQRAERRRRGRVDAVPPSIGRGNGCSRRRTTNARSLDPSLAPNRHKRSDWSLNQFRSLNGRLQSPAVNSGSF